MPWRLIGETVRVVVSSGRVSIQHGGHEVAAHPESAGRRQRLIERAHFEGVSPPSPATPPAGPPLETPAPADDLLRPLREYEGLVGGGWRWSTTTPSSAC